LSSRVFIVLATRNGEKYLQDQIDSLIAQTETGWNLLIRDDGSTDDTTQIIARNAVVDQRIRIIPSENFESSSAGANFSYLLTEACHQGADYVLCCDQDDVWKPNKIERILARIRGLEGKNKKPSLVHHDLTVVNQSLDLVADSFVDLMQLQPADEANPQRLITRNEVTGCAMACNRALLEIALPISKQAVMHDWWLALCAGFFGRLEYIPDRLVKYRQHPDNTIGAKSVWHGLNPKTNWIAGWRRGNEEFLSTVRQARAFRDSMRERLKNKSEEFEILNLYCEIVAASRWRRLQTLSKCGLWRNHWLLNVILVMRMLLLPRTTMP
jgi:glycosyltransferase involved in cell wall biosynthesis